MWFGTWMKFIMIKTFAWTQKWRLPKVSVVLRPMLIQKMDWQDFSRKTIFSLALRHGGLTLSVFKLRQYLIVSWHIDCTSISKSFYKSKTCKEVTSPLEKIHIVSIFHFLTLSLWFFLQKQFFFWSNVLWKESNSKKVIFEIFRMGSHDEKEGTLVELWSLRKVKYPSLNLLCLLFQFSL